MLTEVDDEAGRALNHCFYLSTAPEFFPVIVKALGAHGLDSKEGAEVRVIIEKPFGTRLAEARELNEIVLSVFEERQVFRIDHYLGKETVQNVLALRFANGMFEPLWNRNYIDHVQITASEDIGIGSRAGYYDNAGALRDLVQNHMLQLLTLLCMEPPVDFSADEVRDEKVKVLRAIHAPTPRTCRRRRARAVRARQRRRRGGPGLPRGAGRAGGLEHRDVRGAAPGGRQLALGGRADGPADGQAPRAQGHGDRRDAQARPHLAFREGGSIGVRPNVLVLTVQPNEGVSLSIGAKIPGTRMAIRPVQMEFLYGSAFLSQSPEAYERLILDAMRGDATLFTRNDEVEAQWRICDPIVAVWEQMPGPLPQYEAGSQGPAEAESLLAGSWRTI